MISMRTRFCCPIDRYWPRQRISRLACFNSLWFCNKAHLHCLWQHLHCCCANLVFVAGGGDWKRGEAKINGKLIQIWKDYMPLGILFWFWIDMRYDPLPPERNIFFIKGLTYNVCNCFIAGSTPIACSAEKTRLHEMDEESQEIRCRSKNMKYENSISDFVPTLFMFANYKKRSTSPESPSICLLVVGCSLYKTHVRVFSIYSVAY